MSSEDCRERCDSEESMALASDSLCEMVAEIAQRLADTARGRELMSDEQILAVEVLLSLLVRFARLGAYDRRLVAGHG